MTTSTSKATTSDQSYMKKQLGMNPGLVDMHQYVNVTIEPVSFEFEENLGWGETWSAVHEGFYTAGQEKPSLIEGGFFTFETKTHGGRGYKALLAKWRKHQEELDQRLFMEEQDQQRCSDHY